MMGSDRPQDTTAQAAAEGRRLLTPPLCVLQERQRASAADADPLTVAEKVASAANALFLLERGQVLPAKRAARINAAIQALRDALQLLAPGPDADSGMRTCADGVSRALAVLYPAASAEARSAGSGLESTRKLAQQVPPPRSKRALMLVDADAEAGDAAAPQASEQQLDDRDVDEEEQSFPLTQRSRRVCERATIEVEVGFGTDTNFFAGLSLDLSTGGLFVATYKLRAIGTPVTLSFVLPGGHEVKTEGRVVWVREVAEGGTPPGMGIAFNALSAGDLATVRAFCRERAPMYHDYES